MHEPPGQATILPVKYCEHLRQGSENLAFHVKQQSGGVAEWIMAAVLKLITQVKTLRLVYKSESNISNTFYNTTAILFLNSSLNTSITFFNYLRVHLDCLHVIL